VTWTIWQICRSKIKQQKDSMETPPAFPTPFDRIKRSVFQNFEK
jgi:hypothetical protein